MNKINFIPCAQWIRRGVAKEMPDKLELTKEDLKRIIEQHRGEADPDEYALSDESTGRLPLTD